MKNTALLRTIAFASLVLAGPAMAADMPLKAAPAPVAPAFIGYFEFSGLAMTRSKAESNALISGSASPGSGNVLNSGDFDYGWTGGAEVRAGGRWGAGSPWGVEIAGQWLHHFRDSRTSVVPAPGGVVFQTLAPVTTYGIATGGRFDSTSTSGIYSIEGNLTWWNAYRGVVLLAGVRYIRLHDSLGVRGFQPAGAFIESDDWNSTNSMIGGQLGLRVDFLDFFGHTAGPWLFDGHVRGGVFYNEITNDMGRDGIQLFHVKGNETAYVVQGGLNIGYRINTNIAITAGYEAMWLDGVALSPNQVNVTPNFNCGPCPGVIGIRTEDLLIHGVKVGLRIRG
jgi:hypothetical protein